MVFMKRAVVITGIGLVTPLGNDAATSWQGLLQGESGIDYIQTFDAKYFSTHFAGEVRDFDILQYMSVKESRKCGLFVQYAIAAAQQALADAGIADHPDHAERYGVCVGSGIGGIGGIEQAHLTYLDKGSRRISPHFIPGDIINMPNGYISIRHGFRGPSLACATACTTGTHMIGLAKRMIEYGEVDVVLAGGTESPISHLSVGGFAALRGLSKRNDDPPRASRPWDQDRDGFVLAEGAGLLVVEALEHAAARNARIYARLDGFGMSSDSHHITAPPEDGEGACRSMKLALQDAMISGDKIDYINAHGTSTPLGDLAEVRAIKKVFGDQAYRLAISSNKSMIGHMLGASGSVEAAYTALTLQQQIIPPTINLDQPGTECDLNFVPQTPQRRKIRYALSNSFGFGGTNGSLVFSYI